MVLELVDAALQAIEPISQRTAAWQAFARCAVPQLGLGSFARLVVLLQQYGPAEDAELALLLWQGEITQQAAVLKAVQRLRHLVAFLQSQGITALMARSNSPTLGHPKFPQAGPPDYDDSGATAMRAAASLRR